MALKESFNCGRRKIWAISGWQYLRAVSLAGEMAGPKLQAMTPELVPHQIIPGHVKRHMSFRIY